LAKSILQDQGHYHLSEKDKAQIDVFEKFADTRDCVLPPDDQRGSGDNHWDRLLGDRRMQIALSRSDERLVKIVEGKLRNTFKDDAG
jgi:hypothetical protein